MNIKRIIREEMDGLDWIKDEELPILPYIGKRFKLIRDDGQDSGRRYQILEYYFEDEYNKDFYIKSIILNPETLKPRTETPTRHKDLFHTPLSRAMELINNGNWVFLDTINESQDDFDWVRETNPMDEIVRALLNSLNITGQYATIYFRPWNYNIPYHVIKPDRLRSFDDSYNRIKDEFFRYLSLENGPRIYNNRNIIELLPLDLIKFVRNGLSDDQKEYIWDKFIDGILKQLDFYPMKHQIDESQDEFDWVDNPDIPLRPYPGEEYIWIGWGKNSHTGASKRSIRFGTKLSDVIRIRHVDEPPLTGVYFESVDDKYNRDTTNIKTWNRLVRSGKIIPVKGMGINESQDDFDWVRDSDPIEVIDLNDQWHVDTIESGDKLEITGEYDGIEFHNEPCEVVCVATCSKKVRNAWEHQILVSFEREFYSEETDETTHCGPDSRSEEKCNCEVYAMDRYGDPLMKGTCWWIHVPSLDEVVRINVGGITESEKILESLFNKLSILTEDGKTEPDMEWDFTKGELDKSKRWVKTKEDVKKYLTLLFDKMKRIPKRVKLNILKYVLASFIGIITFTELQQMVDEVSPEKIELNFTKKEKPKVAKKPETIKKPEVVKNVNVRKPSSRLYDFLRDEEKLRTTAYDIGDGMITVGYGHAERGGETDMVAGKTKISKEKAEELLKQDVGIQTKYLNRILRQWEEKGIKPKITQGMYDSMISLMFNMGYGNFRKADFVQDIKKGDFKTAKEKIRKTHITYPGHKPRREKESQMFDLP